MIGGALVNAFAFTGSNYLFKTVEGDRVDRERKRHDLALEKLQKARDDFNKKRLLKIDFINKRLAEKHAAEARFNDLDDAMSEYHRVFGKRFENSSNEQELMGDEPVLKDFYKPSDDQHNREIAFIVLDMIDVGSAIYLIK